MGNKDVFSSMDDVKENKRTKIDNFHVLNKDVLYMHHIGATQELQRRISEFDGKVQELVDEDIVNRYNILSKELNKMVQNSDKVSNDINKVSEKVLSLSTKMMEEERKMAEIELERVRRDEVSNILFQQLNFFLNIN